MKAFVIQLNDAAESFIQTASEVKLSKDVYENGWNAKKIIGHIVHYHEYYARVIEAMAKGKELPLIDESLAKVNLRSANEYSRLSRDELIKRFEKANNVLTKNIVRLNKEAEIPYKKGGRIYTPEEYISEISRHIDRHTKDLKRQKRVKNN